MNNSKSSSVKKLAVLGMGHIGSYVLDTLSKDPNFNVSGYDLSNGYNLSNRNTVADIIKNVDGVLASTPFFLNKQIAELCNEYSADYFDLTESIDVTDYVKTLNNAKFVTQCGLAPGMVSIIANNMAVKFDHVKQIQIRVGALPMNANNRMSYYRTWNTEGLINEYIHPCPAIRNKQKTYLEPLTEFENITLEGQILEAVTTSGGLGSMADTWSDRAESVDYKTLRYPGHWDKMRFLKDDLDMASNFRTFVDLFNKNIPQTDKDYVYILINVTGNKNNQHQIQQYSKRIESRGNTTAIQLTTGHGVMAVLDAWQQGSMDQLKGWIRVEDIDYNSIWSSRYSSCYQV